jgi:hypothetical protein
MPAPTIMGIFDRPSDAERVMDELLEAGVARHRIVIRRQNQPDEPIVGEVPDPSKFDDAVRSGACVVAVAARSYVDKQNIAQLMRRYGARDTLEG